jgi:peptide/nickel transport system permease protein
MDKSFHYKINALEVVLERLPSTVELTLVAASFAIPLSIFLGVVSAVKRNTLYDYVAKALTLFGISTPSFWFGIMMILLFSVQWGLLPAMGQAPQHLPQALIALTRGDAQPVVKWFQHIIMPALTLGIYFTALIARMTRTETLENLGRGYVLTAKSKGQSNLGIMVHHVLPNSMIPIITIAGIQVGGLLGGAILTEAVFVWPGMGQLLIDAVFSRDFPVIQSCIVIYAITWIVINFLIDLLYLLIDPRITLT